MKSAKKPAALAIIAVVAMVSLQAVQALQLNPTVHVLVAAQGSVPSDCAAGMALAVPRVDLSESEGAATAAAVVPPSGMLKSALRHLQAAAEGDDYETFRAALAAARAAVTSYPAGGERDAGNAALQVDGDIDRLWEYAVTSPTGAFFDATSLDGSLLGMLKRYPDYGRFIADETLQADGRTLYPTRESRHFLAAEAGKRLAGLGINTPVQLTEQERAEVPRAVPPPSRAAPSPPRPTEVKVTETAKAPASPAVASPPHPTETKVSAGRSKTEKATSSAPPPSAKPPKTTKAKTQVASVAPIPKTPARVAPVPAPVPATPAPGPVTATVTPAPPATTTAVLTTTTVAPPPTDTATTSTTTTSATDTTSTAVASTSSTSTESTDTTATTATTGSATPATSEGGKVNLLLAIILIIVGIGVLVVLFRASD